MKENMISNIDKYYNYKILMKRIDVYYNSGAYLESIMIIYALLEDRTTSICKYLNIELKEEHRERTLDKKINKILNELIKDKILYKFLKKELIEKIRLWAYDRNNIVHALNAEIVDFSKYKSIAKNGYDILKKLNNICKIYKDKSGIKTVRVIYKDRQSSMQ